MHTASGSSTPCPSAEPDRRRPANPHELPAPSVPSVALMEASAPARSSSHARPSAGERAAMHERGGALPNLVIIGAQKCGTSGLHYHLGLHPEISMSKPKELNF